MRVYLIGARGSGKTSVGRALAVKRGWECVDLDAFLVERQKKSVADIVATEGWEKFRDLESAALADAARELGDRPAIIATGGGVVLRPENRAQLMADGLVIWLKADAAALRGRLRADPNAAQRPALTELAADDEIRAVLAEREPLYRQCARHIVDATLPKERVCALIDAIIRNAAG